MSRQSVAEIEHISTMPDAPDEDLDPLADELIARDRTEDRVGPSAKLSRFRRMDARSVAPLDLLIRERPVAVPVASPAIRRAGPARGRKPDAG